MKKIDSFRGENRWLSNFEMTPSVYEGITYPSSEHSYQAAKTLILEERLMLKDLLTPGKVKRAGQKITMRPDWDQIKIQVMEEVIRSKFDLNPELKKKLIDTRDYYLEEGNEYNDTFWGVCKGVGENHLGKVLMKIRDDYLKKE